EILSLLNASLSCFWMKQVFHNKGSAVDQHGARQRTAPFEDFWEFDGTKLKLFPLRLQKPVELARELHRLALELRSNTPAEILVTPVQQTRDALDAAKNHWAKTLQ